MKRIIIDCRNIKTVNDFWNSYVNELRDCDGIYNFGKNLDALWDSLDAGGPGYPEDHSINIINLDGLKFKSLKEGLLKISNELTNKRIELIIS